MQKLMSVLILASLVATSVIYTSSLISGDVSAQERSATPRSGYSDEGGVKKSASKSDKFVSGFAFEDYSKIPELYLQGSGESRLASEDAGFIRLVSYPAVTSSKEETSEQLAGIGRYGSTFSSTEGQKKQPNRNLTYLSFGVSRNVNAVDNLVEPDLSLASAVSSFGSSGVANALACPTEMIRNVFSNSVNAQLNHLRFLEETEEVSEKSEETPYDSDAGTYFIDDTIVLGSQSVVVYSTDKYDIGVPSRIQEVSPKDSAFCDQLFDVFDSQEYSYDYVNNDLRLNLQSDAAQTLMALTDNRNSGRSEDNSKSLDNVIWGGIAIPYSVSGSEVVVRLWDLIAYFQSLGGCVDEEYLGVRLFVGTARGGWDITEDDLIASMRDVQAEHDQDQEISAEAFYNDLEVVKVDPQALADEYFYMDDLRRPTGLSASELEEVLGGVLKDYAEFIVYCEQEYSISAAFIDAVARRESGAGTAGLGEADSKCNIFSMRLASGVYKDYRVGATSVDDAYKRCIEEFCKWVSTEYLSPSGMYWGGSPTTSGVAVYYAEAEEWGPAIEQSREEFYWRLDNSRKSDISVEVMELSVTAGE